MSGPPALRPTRPVLAVLAGLLVLLAAACGSDAPSAGGPTLTLYNAQHETMTKPMLAAFTKATGIKVQTRLGKDFELANQLVQEGDATPADVFITENSPAIQLVSSKGLFAPVDKATLAQVPAGLSPGDGLWVGVAARSTVLQYNTTSVRRADLPASILDLALPAWKDRVGIAPAGADFQAIVSAVLSAKGAPAAQAWLEGLKANARVYQNNIAIMRAVNAGEVATGITYHYYWFQDRAESGKNSKNVELHYFGNQDPGAFVSVSGLGALKASKHPAEAQRLLAFLTGATAQKALASSKALEYPIGSGVTNAKLKPLAELQAPTIDPATLNGTEVLDLLRRTNLL